MYYMPEEPAVPINFVDVTVQSPVLALSSLPIS